ncbi:DUF6292 family protein [Saccharomonospora sp. NPDC046836]|uniref:DUF6292 family protein n=1 Tax=Saccharomonospora sp. NPDC046836 TaxID=3156921 RepID=UPI0034064561
MLTQPLTGDLRRYLHQVAGALGLPPDASVTLHDAEPSGRVALRSRLPAFPNLDALLQWTTRHGWCLAVRNFHGTQVIPLCYLGPDPVPDPAEVARFAREMVSGAHTGATAPPAEYDQAEVLNRLADT